MTGIHSYGAEYMEVHLIPTVLMVLPERVWTGVHGHNKYLTGSRISISM